MSRILMTTRNERPLAPPRASRPPPGPSATVTPETPPAPPPDFGLDAFPSEDDRPTASVALKTTELPPDAASGLPAPNAPRFYRTGDVIDGKYRLEGLLGKGGMGEVWTAHNETLGVLRAVKLIPADLDSPESTDRLLREARAAARLADPAIVRVFDFGKTPWGDPYLVMELLSGEDLAQVIRRRERLSPVKAVRVLLPIIRALSAAHAHGIVHRDLKPENIFLSKLPEGRVQPKLLDFGIAKLKNARALRLTTDGTVIGSPLYMSPEQARGDEVDERTDVWALSVVLYELITGTPPFTGEDRHEVIHAAATERPESLMARGVDDDDLWRIIEQGLAKRPEERWASTQLLGEALARWLLAEGVIDDITGASIEAAWLRKAPTSILNSLPPPTLQFPAVVIREASPASKLAPTRARALLQALQQGLWRALPQRARLRLEHALGVWQAQPLRIRYAARARPAIVVLVIVGLLARGNSSAAAPSGPESRTAAAPAPPLPEAEPTPEPAAPAARGEEPRETEAPNVEPAAPPPDEVASAPAATGASAAPKQTPGRRKKPTRPKHPRESRRSRLLDPFE